MHCSSFFIRACFDRIRWNMFILKESNFKLDTRKKPPGLHAAHHVVFSADIGVVEVFHQDENLLYMKQEDLISP